MMRTNRSSLLHRIACSLRVVLATTSIAATAATARAFAQDEISARPSAPDERLPAASRTGDAPDPDVLTCMFDGTAWRAIQQIHDDPHTEGGVVSPSWILIRSDTPIESKGRTVDRGLVRSDERLRTLLELVRRSRTRWPDTPVAVEGLGLPISKNTDADSAAESSDDELLRAALVRAVSAFAIDRTLLIRDPSSSGLERRWILDRYPDLVGLAGRWPIFYRTPWGWRCLATPDPYALTHGDEQDLGSVTNPDDTLYSELPATGRSQTMLAESLVESDRMDPDAPTVTALAASDLGMPSEMANTPLLPGEIDLPTGDGATPHAIDLPPGVADTAAGSTVTAGSATSPGTTILGSGAIASSFAGVQPRSPSETVPVNGRGGILQTAPNPTRPSGESTPFAKVGNSARADKVGTGAKGGRPAPPTQADRRGSSLNAPPTGPSPSPSDHVSLNDDDSRPTADPPVLPGWITAEDRVVIPITPPESDDSQARPPRPAPPRPEFHTDEDGWTDFTLYLEATSRIMYVAANGNDATGIAYAPNDAAIGADPTQPVGAVQAFATYEAARANMRNFEADWILFRRGDTFTLANGLYSHGIHFFFEHDPNGPTIRKVFGAFGPETDARPILTAPTGALISGVAIGNLQYANSAFVSLDLRAGGVQDNNASTFAINGNRNFHFEDCRLRGGGALIPYDWSGDPNTRYAGNVVFRRCVVVDAARNQGGHVQGMFAKDVEGLTLEECVFDRNGYVEDPRDPSAWTGKLKTDNQNTDPLPVGEGVQPHRTWFSRNLYLSSYTNLFIRGCILTRSASSHQMRSGGVAERNVFMWNDQALAPKLLGRDPAFLQGQTLSQNLVLHEDHLLASALASGGMTAMVGETHEAVVTDNIVTGFNRDARYTFGAQGLESYNDFPAEVGERATFTGNVSYAKGGIAFSLRGTTGRWGNGYHEIDGTNNVAAFDNTGLVALTTELAAPAEWDFGSNHYTTGIYRRGFPDDRDDGSFSEWQGAGFGVGSTEYADVATLAAALGWETTPDAQGRKGWERDIVSYMQSIDPAYVVDENVTVDDGVPVENRRANAPKVWEVLAGLHTPSANFDTYLSEADAKLAARRYHAFLTFIERARANRKGAWDANYTADALNNHIREGFGKEPVGGAYTAVLPGGTP